MVGPATDKHQTSTHRLKLYVRAVIESEAWPTIVQLKRNRDCVENQVYSLSHDIQVISNIFITLDKSFDLITKIKVSNSSYERHKNLFFWQLMISKAATNEWKIK